MKKFIVIIACIVLSARAHAQNEGLPKLTTGIVFATLGTTSFTNASKPFALGYNVSPNILLVTPNTFHNLMYGMAGNTLQLVNGYFINNKRGADVYVVVRKNLALPGGYAGVGIEKLVKADNIPFFLFTEFGNTFSPNSRICTIGFHANIEMLLWKKK